MSVLVLQLVEYGYELPFPPQCCCGKRLLPNPALNPVRFALWTLRDKAAQRRLALLQGLPQIRKCA